MSHRSRRPTNSLRSRVDRPRTTILRLEQLETREVLSTTAHVSQGVLTVTGDAADNNIMITQLANSGEYTVSASDGGGPVTPLGLFINVKSINVKSMTASTTDTVTLLADPNANTALSGPLTIVGGGNLVVDFTSNFNTKGAVKIWETGAKSALTVNGSGPNVNLGATCIIGSSGATSIDLDSVNINGAATFSLGAGNNNVHLGTLHNATTGVSISGPLSITGGSNKNTVILDNNTYVGGRLTGTFGSGDTTFETFNTVVRGDICVTSRGEFESELENTSAGGSVFLDNSAGSGKATIHLDNAIISNSLTINTGSGDDQITIQGVMNGSSRITTGNGANTVIIADAIFKGALDVIFGDGNDSFLVEPANGPVEDANNISTQFFGPVTVKMGGGDDSVVLGGDATDSAQFFGWASFDGGPGSDTFDPSFAKFNGPKPVVKSF